MIALTESHRKRLLDLEAMATRHPIARADSVADPVQVHSTPDERVHVFDVVDSAVEESNPLTRRIIIALGALSFEMEELARTAEREYYPGLTLFGWSKQDDEYTWPVGDLEMMMGRTLPLVQDVSNFTQRCRDVSLNAIQQLAMLYNPKQGVYPLWIAAELRAFYHRFGAMLRSVLTIDLLVKGNPQLASAWDGLQRILQSEATVSDALEGQAARQSSLRSLILALDEGVMTGRSFHRLLHQRYDGVASEDTGGILIAVESNRTLHDELRRRSIAIATFAAESVGSDRELNEAKVCHHLLTPQLR